MFRSRLFAILCVVVIISGCGRSARLNVEKDLKLEGGSNHAVIVDPAPRELKINVLVRSSPTPVDVYVVLEKDQADVMAKLGDGKAVGSNVLKKGEKMKEGTLETNIPASGGFAVILSNAGGKTADVSVKITEKE